MDYIINLISRLPVAGILVLLGVVTSFFNGTNEGNQLILLGLWFKISEIDKKMK